MTELHIEMRVSVDGEIGHIEQDDPEFERQFPEYVHVRWLTPNNEPSCVCGTVSRDKVVPVSDHVVPMQRSSEWWTEARAFCGAIEAALLEELD